jgi:hypothetical protein
MVATKTNVLHLRYKLLQLKSDRTIPTLYLYNIVSPNQ